MVNIPIIWPSFLGWGGQKGVKNINSPPAEEVDSQAPWRGDDRVTGDQVGDRFEHPWRIGLILYLVGGSTNL